MDNLKTRGRKVGSTSFAMVKMRDLKNYLGDESLVKVSVLWLKAMGLCQEIKPINLDKTKIKVEPVSLLELPTVIETITDES